MDASGSNPSPEKVQPSTSPSLYDGAVTKPRILIVEDNKADAYLIREAIDRCRIPADIVFVRDGSSATQYFDAVDSGDAVCPDLVLLDLNLPKISGGEVLKHLRGSGRCENTQVVIVSSSDAMEDRGSVESLGIAGYFKKPSTYADFMRLGPMVQAVLDRRGQGA